MILNCVLIDDEPLALKKLSTYVEKTSGLKLIGAFENPIDALEMLEHSNVDVLFVDIQMPDINGVELVKSLSKVPQIIFTTAHREFAADAFRLNATDYLLKPYSYALFLEAISKLTGRIESPSKEDELSIQHDFMFVRSDYKTVRINFNEILFVEGMREYVRIHLTDKKKIMTLMSISKLAEFLPSNAFLRVHRSYIVNLKQVKQVERNRIIFDQQQIIPIGEAFQEEFDRFLKTRVLK